MGSRQQAQIIGSADVYVSAFGSHNLRLNRQVATDTVLGLDMSTWAFATLRPFQVVDIAKIGDAERRMLLVEWTLVCKTPTANMKATGAA